MLLEDILKKSNTLIYTMYINKRSPRCKDSSFGFNHIKIGNFRKKIKCVVLEICPCHLWRSTEITDMTIKYYATNRNYYAT
jgi:hypothetical protein